MATASSRFLIRFSGDLSTKRGRAFAQFRSRLARNIRDAMQAHELPFELELARNRFYLEAPDEAAAILARVFGIQSFSPVTARPWSSFDDLVALGEEEFTEQVLGKTFAVRVRRSRIRGQVDFSSEDLERALGARLLPHSAGVDLGAPDFTAHMELDPGVAHLFGSILPAQAGLPVGTEGKALSLISGGIDSAAASWLMLKRGVRVDYLFYNLGGSEHENQVLEVIQLLARDWSYGYRPKLWLVDLRPWVQELRERTPERLWQVILKRVMLRGAQEIARRAHAGALVTGEAVGQVSSQTLENLVVIERSCELSLLRPLLGFDKREIIDLARRIGTYELSARVPEYCALQGRSPATRATAQEVEAAESRLDLEAFTAGLADTPYLDLRQGTAPRDAREDGLAIGEIPPGAQVVDLRSRAAFAGWHYPEAVRMDYLEALKAYRHFAADRLYVVCCEVEFKSADLAEKLRRAGRRAFYFAGGTSRLREWAGERELADSLARSC